MRRKASSAREKGSYGAKRNPSEKIGSRLLRALTDEELSALLDALFELLDAKGLATLASRVDSETGRILACLCDGDSMKRKPIATRARCEREWESVWDRWQEVVAELGEEDGRYVDQEHHWEAPYFAGDVFAESLDEVARDMLPCIDRVPWLWTEERDLFRVALLEIKEGVDSYPEWMGEGECALGPVLTTCFLKWEWCAKSTRENGTQELLERLRGIEDELEAIDFDDGAFVEFFTSLPGSSQRGILDAMRKISTEAHWMGRFSSSHSKWHRILNALLAQFDTKSYLDDCMVQLDQEWSYGLPLIEHLVQKHDLVRADEVAAKTFASLLRIGYGRDEELVAEKKLLVEKLGYHSPSPDARIMKLLAFASAIAKGRGDADRAAVMDLQKVIYGDEYRWDEISGAFRKLLGSPISKSARILLDRWETLMAEATFSHLNEDKGGPVDTWVSWLIEAGIDDAKGPEGAARRSSRWQGICRPSRRSRRHIRISRSLLAAKRHTESSDARARGENGWRRWARAP